MDENLKINCCIVLIVASTVLLITAIKSRRWWVRPWILKRTRESRGCLNLINQEFLVCKDLGSFKNYLRMDKPTYEKLLSLVENDIQVQNTHMRESLSASDRLTITLRCLATGESYQSLHYTFRVGQSTISELIPVVCKAIYNNLKNEYLKVSESKMSINYYYYYCDNFFRSLTLQLSG